MQTTKGKRTTTKKLTTSRKKTTKAKSSVQNEFKKALDSCYTAIANVESSAANYRRNRAGTQERIYKYKNLRDGLYPFGRSKKGYGNSCQTWDIQEPAELCQLAYYNFPLFRNTIDIMTELSNSLIFLKGGNKTVNLFIEKWLKKINIWSLTDKFFREYYRSGNVFLYRMDGKFTDEDRRKMRLRFGAVNDEIPLRYIILNPCDVRVKDYASFTDLTFFKLLTSYELERLKNPRTEEDQRIFDNLPPDVKTQIRENGTAPLMELDSKSLTAVFYKKQDYEPFAVPLGFPVLNDIDVKMEFKKMDAAVVRTTEYMILLITMGESEKDGGTGMNPENFRAMQNAFQSESLKKVLISDWTTKAQWVIPDIAKVIGPEKYVQLDKDIKEGLNIILIGEEKFANAQLKTDVFIERLKEARKAFIEEFLQPEIKRVCQEQGFKTFPSAYFEDINLRNKLEWSKLYTKLMEDNILTPDEGLQAMESGNLPDAESSLESQKKFKDLRDEGYYEPLLGGSNKSEEDGGRPEGTKSPQSTKNVSPIGQSTASQRKFSVKDFVTVSAQADNIHEEICKGLRKKYKIRKMSAKQKNTAHLILKSLLTNEAKTDWKSKINEYINNPKEMNMEHTNVIDEIAIEHNIDPYQAILLFHSQI